LNQAQEKLEQFLQSREKYIEKIQRIAERKYEEEEENKRELKLKEKRRQNNGRQLKGKGKC